MGYPGLIHSFSISVVLLNTNSILLFPSFFGLNLVLTMMENIKLLNDYAKALVDIWNSLIVSWAVMYTIMKCMSVTVIQTSLMNGRDPTITILHDRF